ncbi:hypothetical protein SLEP1_g13249 [Rubroshorea leprosula]|uniref:Reverse transcriptase zinc-binding domain-containing protein n=1 Tax=Rubroshorea leprosula TaxID=152421 RepID=A0AAV5IL78_9ROSI|nr:hypothetical protein SLEP1_g13249 [Rubroshorea leprosula]
MGGTNVWSGGEWGTSCSRWWKDIWKLDDSDMGSEGWFKMGIEKLVGEGNGTLFWHDQWVGDYSLKDRFYRLFNISSNKEALISNMGEWRDGEWQWSWSWRRELFAWEIDILQELREEVRKRKLVQGQEDRWIWKKDPRGKYSVSSAYNLLNTTPIPNLPGDYNLIWNGRVPLKVAAFAWKVMQNRIPTKDNLQKRGVLGSEEDQSCVLCGKEAESVNHLLFSCPIAWKVWSSCYQWWGINVVAQEKGWNHLIQHAGLFNNKFAKEAWKVIWFAVVWNMWLWRNQKIFKAKLEPQDKMIEVIKFQTFQWIKAKQWPEISKELWYICPAHACETASKRMP